MARLNGRARCGSWAERLVVAGPAWLLGIAPFVFLKIGGEFENLPKLAFLQWGIGVLALLALLGLGRGRSGPSVPGPIPLDVTVVLFAVALVASLARATNVGVAVPSLLGWLAAATLYGVISRTATEGTVQALFVAGAVGALGTSLLGLAQAWGGLDWIPQAHAPAATFSNSNLAAHHVAIALPLATGLLAGGSRRARFVVAVIWIVSVVYLWISRGRAAWLALAVIVMTGVLGLFVASNKGAAFRRRRVLMAAAVAALVLAAVVTLLAAPWLLELDRPGTGGERAIGILGTGTIALRLTYWSNALALARDHWAAGVGLGNFFIVYPLYHHAAADDWTFGEEFQLLRVHNDHLQWLTELGVPGFVVWVSLLGVTAWTAAVVLERGDGLVRRQSVAVAASVIGLTVIAFFDFPLQRAVPPVWLLAMLGTLAALHRGLVPTREVRRAARMQRALALGFVCAVLAISLWVLPRRIRAEAAHERGAALLAAGRGDQARAELERAQSLAPDDPAIPLLLARHYAEQKLHEKAAEKLQDVLAVHPNHVNALVNLGWCRLEQQRAAAAEPWLARALEIDADSLAALSNLGLLATRREDWPAAASYYERVLALAATRKEYGTGGKTAEHVAVAHLQLGRVRAQQGRLEEAIAHYEAGLSLRPELDAVRATLDELRDQVRGPR